MVSCHDMLLLLVSNNLSQLLYLMNKKKRSKNHKRKRNRTKRNLNLWISLKQCNPKLSLKTVTMMVGAVLMMIWKIGSTVIVITTNGVRITKIGKILKRNLLNNRLRSQTMVDPLDEKVNGKKFLLRHRTNKNRQPLLLKMTKLNSKRKND